MEVEKLVEEINKTFTEPKGLVKASVNTIGGLRLQIGRRDLSTNPDGSFMGCGTQLVNLKTIEVKISA